MICAMLARWTVQWTGFTILFCVVIANSVNCLNTKGKSEGNKVLKELADGNNIAANEMYNVLRDTTSGNIIFSPFSLRTVMAMLQTGARGSTKREIETYMKFPENEEDLFDGYSNLLTKLKSDRNSSVEINMANKIFIQNGLQIEPSFKTLQKTYFKSPLAQLDFSKSLKAAAEINSWVAQNTENKIQNLIEPNILNNRTKLVLVNALHFQGFWENRFFPKLTQKRPFYLDEKNAVDADMMNTEHFFRVGNIPALDARAIVLPYEVSRHQSYQNLEGSCEMIILLPNKRSGLKNLENQLRSFPVQEILRNIPERPKNIVLNFPKFNIESNLDLAEPMQKLGMKLIFDSDNADLSGISTLGKQESLHVSQLIQKSTIKVNEEGTEASAATFAAIFTPLTIGPSVEEEITVDRPFFGYIHDVKTESVLFMFRINSL